MAAESHAGGRGQIVSRVDPHDPGAKRRVDRRRQPPNPNGGTRQAYWFVETVGDNALTASRREEPDSHGRRERYGEVDSNAYPRRSPAWGTNGQPANAERGDGLCTEPWENESSSGCGFPTKTPAQGNGAKPEAEYRRQSHAACGGAGGDSCPAPKSINAIDPASRSGGARQPGGAGHHGDTATATGTSRSNVARCYDAATAAFDGPRRPCTSRSGGARRQSDAAAIQGTSRPGAKQTCGVRHQDRIRVFHSPRRPCSNQCGSDHRHY